MPTRSSRSELAHGLDDRQRAAVREARRAVEDDQEAVADRLDLAPVEAVDLVADRGVVRGQEVGPLGVAELRCAVGRADDVGEEDGQQRAVGRPPPHAGQELLDLGDQRVGVADARHVVDAVELDEARAGDALGERARVARRRSSGRRCGAGSASARARRRARRARRRGGVAPQRAHRPRALREPRQAPEPGPQAHVVGARRARPARSPRPSPQVDSVSSIASSISLGDALDALLLERLDSRGDGRVEHQRADLLGARHRVVDRRAARPSRSRRRRAAHCPPRAGRRRRPRIPRRASSRR